MQNLNSVMSIETIWLVDIYDPISFENLNPNDNDHEILKRGIVENSQV